MQMAGPRGLPASDIEGNEYRATANPLLQTTSSLRLETPHAGSGSSMSQQVLDAFFPSRRSDEVCCAANLPSLEQTRSYPFLQRYRETCVPRVQKSHFPPMTRRCNLRIALCNGVHRTPGATPKPRPPNDRKSRPQRGPDDLQEEAKRGNGGACRQQLLQPLRHQSRLQHGATRFPRGASRGRRRRQEDRRADRRTGYRGGLVRTQPRFAHLSALGSTPARKPPSRSCIRQHGRSTRKRPAGCGAAE